MVKVKFKGHVIEMYDSIQELPITRFQMYNLNLLIDGGIGADLSSFDSKCNSIRRLMKKDIKLADQEISNLQQNLRFIMSKTSPEMNSFVVMIHKIDGREITDQDLTDEGIKDIIKELGHKRLTITKIREFILGAKKKIDFEIETFFPSMTDNGKTKEFYSGLKKRSLLILKTITHFSHEIEEQIAAIDDYLLSSLKPKNYHGSSGLEVQMIKGFEDTCVMLSQHNVSSNPRAMTTLSFYQALERVKEQIKARKRNKK